MHTSTSTTARALHVLRATAHQLQGQLVIPPAVGVSPQVFDELVGRLAGYRHLAGVGRSVNDAQLAAIHWQLPEGLDDYQTRHHHEATAQAIESLFAEITATVDGPALAVVVIPPGHAEVQAQVKWSERECRFTVNPGHLRLYWDDQHTIAHQFETSGLSRNVRLDVRANAVTLELNTGTPDPPAILDTFCQALQTCYPGTRVYFV